MVQRAGDVGFLTGQDYARWSAQGYAHQLIVWQAQPDPGYVLGPQFLTDLGAIVAKMAEGDGPVYVVMFTEYSTYRRGSLTWPQYRDALKAQWWAARDAINAIKAVAPSAAVSWDFAGYSWTGKTTVDLSPYADIIAASEFTSVQAMQACYQTANVLVPNLRNAVRQLGTYAKPVFVSHILPWGAYPGYATMNPKPTGVELWRGQTDCAHQATRILLDDLFSTESLAALQADGLVGITFRHDNWALPVARHESGARILNPHYRDLVDWALEHRAPGGQWST